jgi:2-haloacid dehalogenase
MKKPIETVIFDFGGVLIDWNPTYVFRQVFDDEAEMNYFFEHICTPEWNEQQDAGRSLAEATERLVERHPEYEAPIRAYYGRWEEMLGGPIHGTVEILEEVHARNEHRLYGLTNWSHETFPVALERYDFLQRFQGIVVSGTEKVKKPDPKIYEILLSRYDIQPETAIFIDDVPGNVAAARERGINAVQFFSPDQLRQTLEEWEIL